MKRITAFSLVLLLLPSIALADLEVHFIQCLRAGLPEDADHIQHLPEDSDNGCSLIHGAGREKIGKLKGQFWRDLRPVHVHQMWKPGTICR